MKKFFEEISKALSECNYPQVVAFCGDTVEQIKTLCVENGCCVCLALEGAEVSSANSGFRIKEQSREIIIYYACSFAYANGTHLDDIEKIFSTMHGLRFGNSTLQPKSFKLVNRDSVLVYALNFSI